MKLFAPEYYKDFKCIADRCRHSCCIGWEIDVDGDTMEKYRSLRGGYGKEIIESIDEDETPHFRLAGDERCPHLDERGLCKIITELGEGYLCHICREHPRFYNDTPYGKEVGLGMACEEAARLILSSDGYSVIEEIGEVAEETDEFFFDAVREREKVYSILSDRSVTYSDRLKKIAEKYEISLFCISKEKIDSLEYLDDKHKEMFLRFSPDLSTPKELENHLERALGYFIYRHCTAAFDESGFRASLGFCLFCERLLASMAGKGGDISELARIASEELEYSEDNTEEIKFEFMF